MSEKPPASSEKVNRWDRPKPPHDWRWVVDRIGRTLIGLGLMMFAFVAYQLWGTGIQTAQAQRTLSRAFEEQVAKAPADTTTTAPVTVPALTVPSTTGLTAPVTTAPTTSPVLAVAKPIPADEEAVARLEIPRMDLNRIVVEGATAEALTKGPGHFPETPLPGQLGNAAIAGHRTTNLHPFFDIDKLQPGDEIVVTTLNGRYTYSVTGSEVVAPDDYNAVIPTTDPTKATLTLVSCTPKYSASNRIVVHSELVPDKSDALTEAAAATPALGTGGGTGPLPDDSAVTVAETVADTVADTVTAPATTAPADVAPTVSGPEDTVADTVVDSTASSPDAFSDGWFSDPSAIPQALVWGVVLVAVGAGIYLLSRKVRRYWVGVLAGFIPFIVVLYFFYENVNRLLPPNL